MRADEQPDSEKAPTTWRERRVAHLARRVAEGSYDIPAIEVAHAILFGRPRWGDNPQIALGGGGERVTVRAGSL